MSQVRLLRPEDLPDTLWKSGTQTLTLSPALASAFAAVVTRKGLDQIADAWDPSNSPVGGISPEEANTHFAQMFDGAAARAQLAVTDPNDVIGAVSDGFILALSGADLCITDAPCGAGAAVYSFLSCVAELRERGVLPRLPLNVCLVGGDISPTAIEHARDIERELIASFESQAIFVQSCFVPWDVLDPMSNTGLVERISTTSPRTIRRLVIVANFSGFLSRSRKLKEALPQLEELFRYASGVGSIAIWMEPQENSAMAAGGLFSSFLAALSAGKWWAKFMRLHTHDADVGPIGVADCQLEKPRRKGVFQRVRLSVLRFDLDRTS